MSNKITAAQLLAQQKEQEQKAAEQREAQRKKNQEDAQRAQAQAEELFAKRVADTWDQLVKEAARKVEGARFVVLGHMVGGKKLPPYMKRVEQEITTAGFRLELGGVAPDRSVTMGGRRIIPHHIQHESLSMMIVKNQRQSLGPQGVMDATGKRGWYAGVDALPHISEPGGGTHYELLLRWGE